MEQNANALPKVTLGQYKGLEFTRRVRPVSEKAVELEAANLTRTHAPFAPVEKSAARGMRVTLDFEGFMDGAPIPESKMENVTVVLGTGQLMPAAEDAVYGHKAGESFRFDFTYPAEFRVPELSGKTAQFAITLHTVEQKQPVPLDDAFAKTLGFDTVDALKESIREKKRRSHEANADRIAGAALLGMAGANLTAELDNAILDQNADHDMNALRERLRRSKMTMELYCKAGQTTPDEVRAAFRKDAERKMRSILAVQAIAKAEQITVSNAEVDAEYVRLSKLHDTPEAEIRNVPSPFPVGRLQHLISVLFRHNNLHHCFTQIVIYRHKFPHQQPVTIKVSPLCTRNLFSRQSSNEKLCQSIVFYLRSNKVIPIKGIWQYRQLHHLIASF